MLVVYQKKKKTFTSGSLCADTYSCKSREMLLKHLHLSFLSFRGERVPSTPETVNHSLCGGSQKTLKGLSWMLYIALLPKEFGNDFQLPTVIKWHCLASLR